MTPAAPRYLLRLNHYILKYPAHYDPILTSSFACSFRFVRTSLRSRDRSCPTAFGQRRRKKIEFPAASQHSVVKQRVGLTDVEVDYSRQQNDREIFGGLVPYGKLWRTGANAVTKIKFSPR